jgi:hypothetical protein
MVSKVFRGMGIGDEEDEGRVRERRERGTCETVVEREWGGGRMDLGKGERTAGEGITAKEGEATVPMILVEGAAGL